MSRTSCRSTPTGPGPDPVPDTPFPRRWSALVAVLVAEAMNLLDATIVQVAAPVVHARLGGAEATIPWFSAAYTLAFALALLTGARLGDRAGRRRVFRIGVVAFAVTSAACACAPGPEALIGLRALQGVAAALIVPQTFGLIRAMFDGEELPRALGAIGPVMGLSAVLGPVLGGVLTHADVLGSSWRAVFLVNLPLAAVVLLLAPRLREDRAPVRPRLDPAGTLLAAAGIALVVCPLTGGTGTPGPAAWVSAGTGVLVLAGFVVQQRRTARRGRAPLVEPALLRGRAFPAALGTSTLFFAVMNAVMIVVVLHLELGLGRGPLAAGLTLLPWSVGLAAGSWVAGARLVPRYGSARVLHAGTAVLAAGLLAAFLAYGASGPGAYPVFLPAALVVAGVGTGLFTTPFFTVALSGVGPQETGTAAGLLNAVQQLGGTLGVAVVGGVYLARTAGSGAAEALAGTDAPRDAVRAALLVAGAILAATALAAAAMTTGRGAAVASAPGQPRK
ncbi:MFS transporter [Streptomyces sp. NPDC001770]